MLSIPCRRGFEVMGGFILGLDGETPEVFDLHIEFIQHAAIAMAMEGLLTVLKGTDLYHRMAREGRLRGDTTGNNLDTQLNFVPEMPEEVLKAGYTRVLNTIYDRRLEQYFARCWTLVQRLDRRQAPTPMATPLRLPEMLRFAGASLRQLLSPQGPAYLRFLSRVLTRHPAMLREAVTLAAKGYHLQKITEQITAVDNFKQYLAHAMEQLHEDIARCAHEGNTVSMPTSMRSSPRYGGSTARSMKIFVTTLTRRSTLLCVRSTPPCKPYTFLCPGVCHNRLVFSRIEGWEPARGLCWRNYR